MQYLALKERLAETLTTSAVAEIELPGDDMDDALQFEYIQAKVGKRLCVVLVCAA